MYIKKRITLNLLEISLPAHTTSSRTKFFRHKIHLIYSEAMEKVNMHLGAIERKLGKANKIAEKREKLSLKDAIKLGRKSNSIVSTVKKTIKDLEVYE